MFSSVFALIMFCLKAIYLGKRELVFPQTNGNDFY